jgi:hypothetical protein
MRAKHTYNSSSEPTSLAGGLAIESGLYTNGQPAEQKQGKQRAGYTLDLAGAGAGDHTDDVRRCSHDDRRLHAAAVNLHQSDLPGFKVAEKPERESTAEKRALQGFARCAGYRQAPVIAKRQSAGFRRETATGVFSASSHGMADDRTAACGFGRGRTDRGLSGCGLRTSGAPVLVGAAIMELGAVPPCCGCAHIDAYESSTGPHKRAVGHMRREWIGTRYPVAVRIAEAARKHAIADEDMLHATQSQISRAAARAETFDPPGLPMDDTTDLRALAEAVDDVRIGEARVRERVALARANGRSWGEIGIALGVSRQAARERFREKIAA